MSNCCRHTRISQCHVRLVVACCAFQGGCCLACTNLQDLFAKWFCGTVPTVTPANADKLKCCEHLKLHHISIFNFGVYPFSTPLSSPMVSRFRYPMIWSHRRLPSPTSSATLQGRLLPLKTRSHRISHIICCKQYKTLILH